MSWRFGTTLMDSTKQTPKQESSWHRVIPSFYTPAPGRGLSYTHNFDSVVPTAFWLSCSNRFGSVLPTMPVGAGRVGAWGGPVLPFSSTWTQCSSGRGGFGHGAGRVTAHFYLNTMLIGAGRVGAWGGACYRSLLLEHNAHRGGAGWGMGWGVLPFTSTWTQCSSGWGGLGHGAGRVIVHFYYLNTMLIGVGWDGAGRVTVHFYLTQCWLGRGGLGHGDRGGVGWGMGRGVLPFTSIWTQCSSGWGGLGHGTGRVTVHFYLNTMLIGAGRVGAWGGACYRSLLLEHNAHRGGAGWGMGRGVLPFTSTWSVLPFTSTWTQCSLGWGGVLPYISNTGLTMIGEAWGEPRPYWRNTDDNTFIFSTFPQPSATPSRNSPLHSLKESNTGDSCLATSHTRMIFGH